MSKKLVTVYGSLLSGMGNWKWCLDNDNSILLGEHILEDKVGMLNLGAFPGLVKTESVNKIFVETYEVTGEIYQRIEHLEGYRPGREEFNLYNKLEIDTPFGKSEIYIYNSGSEFGGGYTNGLMPPNDGDIVNWKKYKMK